MGSLLDIENQLEQTENDLASLKKKLAAKMSRSDALYMEALDKFTKEKETVIGLSGDLTSNTASEIEKQLQGILESSKKSGSIKEIQLEVARLKNLKQSFQNVKKSINSKEYEYLEKQFDLISGTIGSDPRTKFGDRAKRGIAKTLPTLGGLALALTGNHPLAILAGAMVGQGLENRRSRKESNARYTLSASDSIREKLEADRSALLQRYQSELSSESAPDDDSYREPRSSRKSRQITEDESEEITKGDLSEIVKYIKANSELLSEFQKPLRETEFHTKNMEKILRESEDRERRSRFDDAENATESGRLKSTQLPNNPTTQPIMEKGESSGFLGTLGAIIGGRALLKALNLFKTTLFGGISSLKSFGALLAATGATMVGLTKKLVPLAATVAVIGSQVYNIAENLMSNTSNAKKFQSSKISTGISGVLHGIGTPISYPIRKLFGENYFPTQEDTAQRLDSFGQKDFLSSYYNGGPMSILTSLMGKGYKGLRGNSPQDKKFELANLQSQVADQNGKATIDQQKRILDLQEQVLKEEKDLLQGDSNTSSAEKLSMFGYGTPVASTSTQVPQKSKSGIVAGIASAALSGLKSIFTATPAQASMVSSNGKSNLNYTSGGSSPASQYKDLIDKYSKQFGVDPKLAYALMMQESSGNAKAIGDNGEAVGLFQLHPGAAQDAGISLKDRKDPEKNIMAGIKYLSMKIQEMGGDTFMGLAAYNEGAGTIKKGLTEKGANYAKDITNRYNKLTEASKASPVEPTLQPKTIKLAELQKENSNLNSSGGNGQTVNNFSPVNQTNVSGGNSSSMGWAMSCRNPDNTLNRLSETSHVFSHLTAWG